MLMDISKTIIDTDRYINLGLTAFFLSKFVAKSALFGKTTTIGVPRNPHHWPKTICSGLPKDSKTMILDLLNWLPSGNLT